MRALPTQVDPRSETYAANREWFLAKMAIGEDSTEEELGGAEMHSRISGVSDYLAEDELDALRLGREIVAQLNWRKLGPAPASDVAAEPLHDPEELLGLASADVRQPFDVKEVIARIVDGSRFSEFKATYGTTLVTGWATLHGYPLGIVANNGVIFSESAQKGAQFIQLCNAKDVPILFLQNITGMMVGRRYEEGGMIKDGAKMINAPAQADLGVAQQVPAAGGHPDQEGVVGKVGVDPVRPLLEGRQAGRRRRAGELDQHQLLAAGGGGDVEGLGDRRDRPGLALAAAGRGWRRRCAPRLERRLISSDQETSDE